MSELESTNDSLGACDQLEFVIGCDFGAPLTAGGQAKKTIAIEARRLRTAATRSRLRGVMNGLCARPTGLEVGR